MRLVVDANILIAATIRESSVRKILLESENEFYAPEAVVREVYRHLDLICRKNGLPESENARVLNLLLDYIMLVHTKHFRHKAGQARKLIGKADRADVPYVALALSFPNDGIWTEDKHFERQNAVKVWKTADLVL